MTNMLIRTAFSTLAVLALVVGFASKPALSDGAILVVTAVDGPMPQTASAKRKTPKTLTTKTGGTPIVAPFLAGK